MQTTQCEKINHPRFIEILHIDLNDLYDEFLRGCVPYNSWQQKIREALVVRGGLA